MQQNSLNIKLLLLIGSISLLIVCVLIISALFDTETKIVFCNVGQGDGAYIRVKNKVDIVIDTGEDAMMLDCLGRYMPLFDRTIEFVFITHPQFDHMGGLTRILDRYTVERVFMNPIHVPRAFFKTILTKLRSKHVAIQFPMAEESLQILDARILFLWPTLSFLTTHLHRPLYDEHFYSTYDDLNEFSLIFTFQESGRRILFTGDATEPTLEQVISLYSNTIENSLAADILKIPHHGSQNGLNERFLSLAHPRFAVISVGKHNRYGHPSTLILQLLKRKNAQILRTDEKRDLVFTIKNDQLVLVQ